MMPMVQALLGQGAQSEPGLQVPNSAQMNDHMPIPPSMENMPSFLDQMYNVKKGQPGPFSQGIQASMLKTPPPNLGPLGGVSGESGAPGGFVDAIMREYLNQRMWNERAARAQHQPNLMDQQRQQGQSIMNAVPQPNSVMPMGPR